MYAKVRSVRIRGLDLKLNKPVETASGTMQSTPLVLVDLATDAGITGCSYVRCYTPLALAPLIELTRNVGALIEGRDADPAATNAFLQRQFRLLGPQGLTGIAIAAIDMALWDALAKARGVPLVELLGGRIEKVPAYATMRSMSPAAAAREAEEARALGFTAMKVKVGRADLAADLETIRAIRSAVGSGVDLMVDYNQNLSVDDAIERARALDAEDLYWIEEPTIADDYAGHARIAAAAATPIALGENWWGPSDMTKSVEARASDHVTLDVMKLGGVTGWLRAAEIARDAKLPASSHTFPEFSAHLLAVTPTRCRLEYLDHAGPILAQPLDVRDGFAVPPDRPGAGIEWDETAISLAS